MSKLEFTCGQCDHSHPEIPALSRCEKCGGKVQARLRHEIGDFPAAIAAREHRPGSPDSPAKNGTKAASPEPAKPVGKPRKQRSPNGLYESIRLAQNARELTEAITLVRQALSDERFHIECAMGWSEWTPEISALGKNLETAINILDRLAAKLMQKEPPLPPPAISPPPGVQKCPPKIKPSRLAKAPRKMRNRDVGPLGGYCKHEPAIYAALKGSPVPLRVSEIGRMVGVVPQTLNLALQRAARTGHLLLSDKYYSLPADEAKK